MKCSSPLVLLMTAAAILASGEWKRTSELELVPLIHTDTRVRVGEIRMKSQGLERLLGI